MWTHILPYAAVALALIWNNRARAKQLTNHARRIERTIAAYRMIDKKPLPTDSQSPTQPNPVVPKASRDRT